MLRAANTALLPAKQLSVPTAKQSASGDFTPGKHRARPRTIPSHEIDIHPSSMDNGQSREMPCRPRHKLGSASEPAAEHVAQSVLCLAAASQESRVWGGATTLGWVLAAGGGTRICVLSVCTHPALVWRGASPSSLAIPRGVVVCLAMPARRGELGPRRSWTKSLAQEMQVQSAKCKCKCKCNAQQREPPTSIVPFSSPCPLRKGTQEPEPGGHWLEFLISLTHSD
jgi:hypothetical protein